MIKELVYEFTSKDGKRLSLNNKSTINLIINDQKTSINILSLFASKADIDKSDIMGYSILQLLKNSQLKVDENNTLKIELYEVATNREFCISKIRRPIIYDDDISITDDQRIQYTNILLDAIKPVTPVGDNGLDPNGPGGDIPGTVKVLGGDKWENFRNILLEKNFKEFVFGNYRFFYNDGNIGFYKLILNDYIDIELFEEKIDRNEHIYSFKNNEGTECELIFNIEKQKIVIKQTVI